MQITPFLWFDNQAAEAATFYVSLFKNSKITGSMPGPGGKLMSVTFELEGRPFIALNGGPHYQLTPAYSMFVSVETQAEVDDLWAKLTANGGEESRCGWLKDRFGLSWQIIPTILGKLLSDKDKAKSGRAMEAMLKMNSIHIATLKKAAQG